MQQLWTCGNHRGHDYSVLVGSSEDHEGVMLYHYQITIDNRIQVKHSHGLDSRYGRFVSGEIAYVAAMRHVRDLCLPLDEMDCAIAA